MFRKVLVANRGEIALRVIRACRELGIKVVAVHSSIDADSLWVRLADESICIGPNPSAASYLNISQIISAAEVTGAEAIHPGYGFLSENPEFAEVCASCGIKFIGPTSDQIRATGDKILAKAMMKKAGVPVIPGSDREVSLDEARRLASELGYPVVLKAAAGGGGKGMRVARDERELETGFWMAQAEADSAFGDPRLYLEKLLEDPRHIEFQVLGDGKGQAVHLGERECSIQRRHQKLIEECPSPVVDIETRHRLGELAVRGAQTINYEGALTVEFMRDRDGNFYFMEMNSRIQVEHPVTEEVTGVDLVKAQIQIAAGEGLELHESFVNPTRHAIECRINAEDPEHNFAPAPGRVSALHLPGGFGVRVDSHLYPGYTIPPFYDSLIAKFIVVGRNRQEAIARMERALKEAYIEGIPTTIPFHLWVLGHERFRQGDFSTSFLDELARR